MNDELFIINNMASGLDFLDNFSVFLIKKAQGV